MAASAREPRYRGLALGLAATLLLVLALVGTAPFWAPRLPWGDERPGSDPAIVGRLERLEEAHQQIGLLQQQIAAATSAMPQLEQRVGTLEQKPPTPPTELAEMQQQIAAISAGISDLASRLERTQNSVQAQATSLSDLTMRLDRAEQAQQAQAANLAARLDPLQQGLRAQQSAAAELGDRMQAFEKAASSRSGDLTDVGLTLALLQIRRAVEIGRPFPAEYETLSSLAKARPEIAAAAAPLATAAPTGTANRVALSQELRAVAQRIDEAPAAFGAGDGWTGATLDRLRGLVRIRRADEAEPSREAEAAVRVAERALADGDLARAVAAMETLQGPAAAAAADWLRRARERLPVEAALQRLEALMTGRLGDTAAMPGSPG